MNGEGKGLLLRAVGLTILLCCLLFGSTPWFASQPPSTAEGTWAQAFEQGSLTSFSFLQENPAGLVFAGSVTGAPDTSNPLILQEDPDGQILWQKSYGSWAEGGGFVRAGHDGGFVVGGMAGPPEQPLLWLASLDAAGAMGWQESVFAPPYRGFVDSAFATKDGWFLHGTVISPLFQSQTPALIKLSATGAIEWQWTYKQLDSPGGGGDQYSFSNVVPLEDGGLLVAGTVLSALSGDMDMLLLRIGPDGLIVWQQVFGGPDDESPAFIEATDDGGFFVVGTVVRRGVPVPEEDSYSAWVIRLNGAGEVIWQELLQAGGNGLMPEFGVADPAGGFLVTGLTEAFGAGGTDTWAAKLDDGGALVWQKSYGGPGPDWAAVAPDPAGGYLLQGTTAPDSGSPTDVWLAKLDEGGEILWQKYLGGAGDDWAGAGRISDGRILVAGLSPPAFGPETQAWTVVLDPDGAFGTPCLWIRNADLTALDGTATVEASDRQPAKGGLTEYSASFAVGASTVIAADGTLIPEDLCPPLDPLVATAEADVTSGTEPLSVQFTGSATGGAGGYAFAWDFGDGGSSADQNPVHDFAAAGDYGVTLTVTDALSQTASDGHLVIHVAPQTVFTASASADVTAGDIPLSVQFTGSAAGGTPPYSYSWTFGDGGTSTDLSPSHTYSVSGAYSALLTVTDDSGATALSPEILIHAYEPLTAALTGNPTSGVAPLSVTFSIVAQGGDGVYSYGAIHYGDGESGTGPHTYTGAGTYEATATVTDGTGHTVTTPPVTITVSPALAASASADSSSGTAPLTVHFSGAATGGTGGYTFAWAFGDGGTSTSQNPEHTYSEPGSYSAVLTVTDSSSQTATAPGVPIEVVAPLAASASADAASGTAPLTVHFTGAASGGTSPYGFAWDFGDSGTSGEQSPSHTYATPGTFHVTLTVTDSASRTATDTHLTVEVAAPAAPPVISLIKKAGSPFRLIVTGDNLQNGIRVFINGTEWTNVQWKKTIKIKILGGKSLKTVVPKGVPTDFTFVNPDGGTATVTGWSY